MSVTDLVYCNGEGIPVTTSLIVADYFGKKHLHVMEAIKNILSSIEKSVDVESQKIKSYYELSSYESPMPGNTGAVRKVPMYIMNENGFLHLAMGFTGDKARIFKERYFNAFKAMRNTIQQSISFESSFLQAIQPIIQSQAQISNQMMQLCNTLMQYMGGAVSPQPQPVAQPQPQPTTVINPEEEPAIDDLYPWEGVVNGYARLRRLYPHHVTVIQAAEQLRSHGIGIRQKTLYRFLREEGYISGLDRTYHRPSRVCVEKGWMVCTQSGRMDGYPKRRYHTPHLSPEFVDMLKLRLADRIQRQLEFGKEVQP